MQTEQEYLQSVFTNSPTGMLICTSDGKIINANNSFLKLSGYLQHELNTISYPDLTHPEDKLAEKSHLADLLSGRSTSFSSEKKLVCRNGNYIWIFQTVTRIQDKCSRELMFVTIEDITGRKNLEIELKNEFEKNSEVTSLLNSIINAIPDIIGIQNTNHELIRYNTAGYLFLGKSHEEIAGKKCYSLIGRNEKCDICSTSECLKTKKPEQHQQFFPEYNVWLDMRSYPVINAKGEITYVIEHLRDITDIKNIEMSLVRSKEKAEESDLLKSSFLANMSHEIRTPMNGILGFAELLRDPSLSKSEANQYIEIIRKSGERMLNILNNLIDVSKIEAGETLLKISWFNLNQLCEELFEFFKPEAGQKGLKFSFNKGSADAKVSVYSDRDKLSVILSNLIDNALKFTSRGTVEFGYVADNASLEFYVSDTGTGITSEQKKVIFERFRQGSESLSRNYEGTGLGLYISKKYTEILGGKIRVENNIYSSVEGPGAKFCFSIPLHNELPSKDQSGDGVSKPEAKLSMPRKKLNILIAEDDKPSQLFLTKMVQPFSRETFFAATGTGAVDLCRNNPGIDLILMDIKLAEMDGYEATRQIRNFNKDVIIIAQTAYAQSGDRDLALGSGCNDYITKPIREAEFYILLNKYFNTGIKNTLPDKKQL